MSKRTGYTVDAASDRRNFRYQNRYVHWLVFFSESTKQMRPKTRNIVC